MKKFLVNFSSILISLIIYYLFFINKWLLKEYFLGFMIVLLFFLVFYTLSFRKEYSFSFNKKIRRLYLLFLFFLMVLSLIFRILFSEFDIQYSKHIFRYSAFYFLAILLLYTTNEEILFRGLIQSSLDQVNDILSIIVTSILFTYPHFMLFSEMRLPFTYEATIYVFLSSLILSISLTLSKSYVLPILLHLSYNYYSYIQLYLEIYYPLYEIMLWLSVLGLLIILNVFFFRREIRKMIIKHICLRKE